MTYESPTIQSLVCVNFTSYSESEPATENSILIYFIINTCAAFPVIISRFVDSQVSTSSTLISLMAIETNSIIDFLIDDYVSMLALAVGSNAFNKSLKSLVDGCWLTVSYTATIPPVLRIGNNASAC